MTGKRPTPPHAIDHLVSLVQSTFTDEMSAREQEGFDRLANAMAPRPPRRSRRWLTFAVGLSAAALLVSSFILVQRNSHPGLSFRITSGASSSASDEASPPASRIDFSDGSSVVLEASARASVSEVGDHGARVHLDRGRLNTHFVHLRDARWVVDAGPYLVMVTGTTFDMAWTPSDQIMEVWLHKGAVVVQGPLAEPGISMVAGQHLRASGLTGQIVLDRMEPTAATPPSEKSAMSAPAVQTAEPLRPAPASMHDLSPRTGRTPVTRKPAAGETETNWGKLLAHGESERILAEAQARGVGRTLATAPSADLAALADAARYARMDSLAARVLLAERERFPRSLAAQDAAFFLAGIHESRSDRSSLSNALAWYDRYLREADSGSYVAQALGRKLLVLEKLHDTEAARQTADDYLKRFPTGPYAATAKRIATGER